MGRMVKMGRMVSILAFIFLAFAAGAGRRRRLAELRPARRGGGTRMGTRQAEKAVTLNITIKAVVNVDLDLGGGSWNSWNSWNTQ